MGQGVLRAVRYASDASGWHDIVISTNVETVVGLIYRGCSRLRRLMPIESSYITNVLIGKKDFCGHGETGNHRLEPCPS
jgi:hypothetical protein